jgi:hypothetical protein
MILTAATAILALTLSVAANGAPTHSGRSVGLTARARDWASNAIPARSRPREDAVGGESSWESSVKGDDDYAGSVPRSLWMDFCPF